VKYEKYVNKTYPDVSFKFVEGKLRERMLLILEGVVKVLKQDGNEKVRLGVIS
jgi:hypothetical protein